jgi:D-serine deaminase-like pyridoxal phosphate-dependent protein
VKELAREYPQVRISALVDQDLQIPIWRDGDVGLFVDVNPGMDRTGVAQERPQEVARIASAIREAQLDFRGLHYYDGHLGDLELVERTAKAHRGYDQLMQVVAALGQAGITVGEVITAGTPALPCSLSYWPFRNANFRHRVSPGTAVYSDATSLAQLPEEYGYRPAALVLTRVVSQPRAGIITCDAGHKSVSADAGIPTCAVLGQPGLSPLSPSEEHLPMEVRNGVSPELGEVLYLVPRHVCPTVNNFEHALMVRNGEIVALEPVSARGREAPLASTPVPGLR